MTVTRCKNCGEIIDLKSTTCPKCGVNLKKQIGVFTYTLVGALALFLTWAFLWGKYQENYHKIEKRQYDFSVKKSNNQYGVTFYNFNYIKAPPVSLLPSNSGTPNITHINDILKNIGEPLLNDSDQYRLAGKKLFVWDNYKKGKLVVDLRECRYDVGDKQTYTCINRLYVEPSSKEMMINQAMNSDSRIFVSKEEYGDQWPFTVDFGIISCRRGNVIVFRTEGNHVYALNGKAIGKNKFKDIRQIWRDKKISLHKLILEGLHLCE